MSESCDSMTPDQVKAVEAKKEDEKKEEKKEQSLNLSGDVRFEGDGVLRYESTVQDKPVRISDDRTTMFGVRGMLAKPVRKDYFYGLQAQTKVHARYEGMPLGVNHDYKQGPPTIERTVGKIIKSYMDDQGTLFDVKLNPGHERHEQILKDAETGLNTISLSCICSRCEQHGNEVTSFEPTGCDFVVNAGQTTKLFEQAASPSVPDNVVDTKFEQLQKEVELLKGKLTRLEQVQPKVVAETVIQMEQALTKRGVDLDAFHADFTK